MIPRIYRSVLVHVAVLVALVRRRRTDRREWEQSPLAHPETGWENDPDSLSGFWPVRVPDDTAVVDPAQSGRHSKGEAA